MHQCGAPRATHTYESEQDGTKADETASVYGTSRMGGLPRTSVYASPPLRIGNRGPPATMLDVASVDAPAEIAAGQFGGDVFADPVTMRLLHLDAFGLPKRVEADPAAATLIRAR